LADFVLAEPMALVDALVTPVACALRLGLFPLIFLLAARHLPVSLELKRVMVVQAAMPAGIFSMVVARYYGGRMSTAAQVIVGTSVLGLVVIPLWLRFGLAWVIP
jgi:predicted permease